jgi:hypothetical protein
MARTLAACCACVAVLAGAEAAQAADVLVLDRDGRTHVRADPLPARAAPAPAGRPPAAPPVARASARRRTVVGELKRLRRAGALDEPTYLARRAAYEDARRLVRRLKGARRVEMGAVVRTLEGIAARGSLTASRVAPLWLTLQRNREWWTTGPLLPVGRRVGFAGSELVWQYYPGSGLQLQVLANFGKLNGLWSGRIYDDRLALLLDELLGLTVDRGGGKAWEYYFTFDGGHPPWVSGLAQATGLQALARAAIRLGRQEQVWPVAKAGLAIFRQAPPAGVRVRSGEGAHYLIYSFSRRLRVINGFVQALVGLRDFAAYANDPDALALFEDGDRAARAEVPRFDTGAWSLYSRGYREHESDLGYHNLLRGFLSSLCQRTATPVYCDTKANFDRYLTEKPGLELLTRRLRGGRRGSVRFALSKISRVGVRIALGDRPVLVRQLGTLGRGRRAIAWTAPRRAGLYAVALTAVDLAGNTQTVSGQIEVLKPRRRGRGRARSASAGRTATP